MRGVRLGFGAVLGVAVLLFGGCAGTTIKAEVTLPPSIAGNTGPAKLAADWAERLKAGDAAGAVALCSASFKQEGFDSAAAYVDDLVAHGVFKDAPWDLHRAEVTMTNDGRAVVYPIRATGPSCVARIRLALAKESDSWRITGMDVEQF